MKFATLRACGRGCIVFKVSFTNLNSLLHEPVKHVQTKNITYWKQLKTKIIVLSPVPCIESCHVLSLKIQGFKNTCRETQELESPLWGIYGQKSESFGLEVSGFQRHGHIFSANSNGRPKSTELKEFFGDFFSQLFPMSYGHAWDLELAIQTNDKIGRDKEGQCEGCHDHGLSGQSCHQKYFHDLPWFSFQFEV